MKNGLLLGGAAIIILAILFFIFSHTPSNPNANKSIGDSLLVTTYTSNDKATGKSLIQVPFIKSTGDGQLSIDVDLNGDGSFSPDEGLILYYPVTGQANWRSGYYVSTETPIENGMKARVTIDGTAYDVSIETKTAEVGDLLDVGSVTDPENAMKGWGTNVAYAHGNEVEVTQDDVPDITQRKGECAPTAAADSLISLVKKHGGDDLIPGDPQDFIENLKRLMNWTPENGVLPDDFVAGKNRWAAHAGVPIRTRKIGNAHGTSTIDDILKALQNGDAVELRIKFADAGGTKVLGGHMVTVTGIHQSEDQTYIDISDPATPDSGTETVEVRGNQLTNYGPWEGITILSWGFAETWEETPTGTLLDTMTDEEINGIRQAFGETPMLTVIEYNGKYLPVSQLKVEDETGCGADHWHAARNGAVTATDGTLVPDPGPQCGYGKVKDRPSKQIPAPNNNTPLDNVDVEGNGVQ